MLGRVLYFVIVSSLIDDLLCASVTENVVEQIVKDIMELKRLKTEQNKRIEVQSEMIKEQSKLIEEQDKRIEEQDKMIEEQDKRIEEQDKRIEEQGKRIEKQEQRIAELEKQLMYIPVKDKRLLMSLSNTHQPVPAFSASLTQQINNLGNNQAITSDNVFTNIGNVYSPHSGAFMAPHNGTYYFLAVIMSHSTQYLETQLCLNGKSLVNIYSYGKSHEQGTNSIVLTLNQGDMVWVRHSGAESSNVYGNNWSSFSGFQIG